MARVSIFLLKPERNARWKIGSIYKLSVSVSASEVSAGTIEVTFEKDIFLLVDSVGKMNLPLGSYEREFTWYLRPIKQVDETQLIIMVNVGIVQAASVLITVV